MRQESVWHYPRPPRVEPVDETIRIVFAGREIVRTNTAKRVLETSHPPTYYLPHDAFSCTLVASDRRSFCEWKGLASYWSLEADGRVARDCAWSYPDPTRDFAEIAGHLAVYAAAMEACFVGAEAVTPQSGGLYGGWITTNLIGPFKGGPGTRAW